MRLEDIRRLNEPYKASRIDLDRRFNSAIGADVPSSGELVREVFGDLNTSTFGVSWWTSLQPEERILISDYLYQCLEGIEVNLLEAKLHYMEWQDALDRLNEQIVDMVTMKPDGGFSQKHPPRLKPTDDLPSALERMHVCGFFRAIGSSLDCLGAGIVGVLALPISLRYSDINNARRAVNDAKDLGNPGSQLQVGFRTFLQTAITDSGPKDWFDWASQYRNMFVHRGRRVVHNSVTPRLPILFNPKEEPIVRVTSMPHLAKYPDKSDSEAMILGKDIVLNEGADITLPGIFESTQNFMECICEELVSIWKTRRKNPSLLEQPPIQWGAISKRCDFVGYEPGLPPVHADEIMTSRVLFTRMIAASLDDRHRGMWTGSKWDQ